MSSTSYNIDDLPAELIKRLGGKRIISMKRVQHFLKTLSEEDEGVIQKNVGVTLKEGVVLVPLIYKTPSPSCFKVQEGDTITKRTLRDNVIINQMLDVYTGHAYDSTTTTGSHWYCPYNYCFNDQIPEGFPGNIITPQQAKMLIDSGQASSEMFEGKIKWSYINTSRNVESYFNNALQLYNGGTVNPQVFKFTPQGNNPKVRYFMTVKRVRPLLGKVCNFNQSPVSTPDTPDDENWTATLYRAFAFDIISWEDLNLSGIASGNAKELYEAMNWIDTATPKTALSPVLISGPGN